MENLNHWLKFLTVALCIGSVSGTAIAGTCCQYSDGTNNYIQSNHGGDCPMNASGWTGSASLQGSQSNVSSC